VLDPTKIAGKIVVCDRGTSGRVSKSLAVRQGGGVGMVLLNTSPGSINADLHFVPTVHLGDAVRPAIKDYAATANASARINPATVVFDVPAPFTAAFSSRGPLTAGAGDVLSPMSSHQDKTSSRRWRLPGTPGSRSTCSAEPPCPPPTLQAGRPSEGAAF
jgi:hypothetical protein